MRVAYVCTDAGIPVFGRKGASVHVQAVLRALRRRGADVRLVAARTGGPAPRGLEGVPVHELPPVGGADAAERERSARACDAAVPGVLDELSRDAELDLVLERYALWGRSATGWARAHGVPSVLEVNAPLVEEQTTHRTLVDRAAAERVARDALSAADVVACVSTGAAAWARRLSSEPARVRVVPNGVDVERVRPATTPPAAAPFVLGFVGTLRPWHGVDVLADVLAALDRRDPGGYRLLVVGDGPARQDLVDRAAALGVAGLVEVTGSVAPDEVVPHLHRMHVATAPYRAADGFYFSPLKVYEYLAAGVPVVASAVGDLPGLLQGGRLGVLVPPDSVEALTDAVAALRADAGRRASLALAGRDAVVASCTWDAVLDRLLADVVPVPADRR